MMVNRLTLPQPMNFPRCVETRKVVCRDDAYSAATVKVNLCFCVQREIERPDVCLMLCGKPKKKGKPGSCLGPLLSDSDHLASKKAGMCLRFFTTRRRKREKP